MCVSQTCLYRVVAQLPTLPHQVAALWGGTPFMSLDFSQLFYHTQLESTSYYFSILTVFSFNFLRTTSLLNFIKIFLPLLLYQKNYKCKVLGNCTVLLVCSGVVGNCNPLTSIFPVKLTIFKLLLDWYILLIDFQY